jgi:hypothetical protein
MHVIYITLSYLTTCALDDLKYIKPLVISVILLKYVNTPSFRDFPRIFFYF